MFYLYYVVPVNKIILLLFLLVVFNGFSQSTIAKRYETAYEIQYKNPKQALVIADSIALLHQNEIPEWKILSLKANIFLTLRNINASIPLALKADSLYYLFHHTSYPLAQSVLGIAYKDLGNLKKAHEHFELSIENSTDPVFKIINLFNLASIALTIGDTTNALQYFQNNFNFILAPPASYPKAYCMRAYADIQFAMNNDPVAMYWYKKSFRAFSVINDAENAGFACANIARVFTKNKIFDSSYIWAKQALTLQEKNNSSLGLADAMLCLGQHYTTLGQNEQALYWYKKALPQTLQANVEDFLEENYKGLSTAYERTGDLQNSFYYLKKYNAIVDSVAKRKWFSSLVDAHYNYEISQREEKIKSLYNLLAENSFITILISIIISAITAYFLYKKLKLPNKLPAANIQKQKNILPVKEKNNLPVSFSEEKEKIWIQLIELLEGKEIFCNPDINLQELALQLKTNRTTLSDIINKKSSQNFTSFINKYRINKACTLLGDENNNYLSVEGIGLKSGFRSRSAFYTAFNNVMNESPNSFRKKAGKQ